MLPLATPSAARHIMAVTPTAMMAAWPMLSSDSDFWFLIWAAVHLASSVL
jgi:hypothetical protein